MKLLFGGKGLIKVQFFFTNKKKFWMRSVVEGKKSHYLQVGGGNKPKHTPRNGRGGTLRTFFFCEGWSRVANQWLAPFWSCCITQTPPRKTSQLPKMDTW
jgi:hypothetical protein